MSFENYCWWHLILTCKGQWLPGDPRGFRSRKHRIHSSGDYKHRPPTEEHAGLHAYQNIRCDPAVKIPETLLPTLGMALLNKSGKIASPCLTVAVSPTHTHLLLAMVNNWDTVKKQAGQLKQASSHTIGYALPGRIWAGGGKPIRIKDKSHQQRVIHYICNHAREGAWVWRFDQAGAVGEDPGLRVAQDRLRLKFSEERL